MQTIPNTVIYKIVDMHPYFDILETTDQQHQYLRMFMEAEELIMRRYYPKII